MPTQSTHIQIITFGTPGVSVAGQPIKLKRQKSLALLAYLAHTQAAHSREHIAALLWPEARHEVALSGLRNVLTDLNSTPLAPFIDSYHALQLSGPLDVDLWRYRALYAQIEQMNCTHNTHAKGCIQALHALLDLYRGDFLADFQVKHAPNFGDWQYHHQLAFRRQVLAVYAALTKHYTLQQHDEAAISIAGRWLAHDVYNEAIVRLLMQLHARNAADDLALARFNNFQHMLKQNLQRTPDARTIALYEEIQSGQYRPRSPVAELSASLRNILPRQPRRLVGREEDVAMLKQHLGIGAPDKRQQVIVLSAPPGYGKSTLVAHLAHDSGVQNAFRDGILWSGLGRTPNLENILRLWMLALGISEMPNRPGAKQLALQLAIGLQARQVLLILDDVWALEHMKLFTLASNTTVIAITSQANAIAHPLAAGDQRVHYALQPLTTSAALALLHELAPEFIDAHPKIVEQLLAYYGTAPMLLHALSLELQVHHPDDDIHNLLKRIGNPAYLLDLPTSLSDIGPQETAPTIRTVLQEQLPPLPPALGTILNTLYERLHAQAPLTAYWLTINTLQNLTPDDAQRSRLQLQDCGLLLTEQDDAMQLNPVVLAFYCQTPRTGLA